MVFYFATLLRLALIDLNLSFNEKVLFIILIDLNPIISNVLVLLDGCAITIAY